MVYFFAWFRLLIFYAFCGVAIERASAKLCKDLTFLVIPTLIPVIRWSPSYPALFVMHRRRLLPCQGELNNPSICTTHQWREARLMPTMKTPITMGPRIRPVAVQHTAPVAHRVCGLKKYLRVFVRCYAAPRNFPDERG